MSDLDNLIAAVEAGRDWIYVAADKALPARQGVDACLAYSCGDLPSSAGSLDAARRLHEALLPSWVARLQVGGKGAGVSAWHCTVEEWDSGEEVDANNMPDPARAWLLAILQAVNLCSVTQEPKP